MDSPNSNAFKSVFERSSLKKKFTEEKEGEWGGGNNYHLELFFFNFLEYIPSNRTMGL